VLPGDPEVTARQEAGDRVTAQVVDPAFRPQLGHQRIDERVASPALNMDMSNLLIPYFVIISIKDVILMPNRMEKQQKPEQKFFWFLS